MTQIREEVPKGELPRVRKGVRSQPPPDPLPDPRSTVRERLTAQAAKEPVVRLSVDVSESLHARIRQYCAGNRIPSARFLIVTLLEDFLESEGY